MSKLIRLESRGLLGLSGADAAAFLQGAITADVKSLKPGGAAGYGAHLTPQGKFLFDFLIYPLPTMFVLDCAKSQLMALAKALHAYAVGREVDFHDLSDDWLPFATAAPDGSTLPTPEALNLPPETLIFADPRLPLLPARVLVPADAGGMAAAPELASVPESIYEATRLQLGIPDGAVDAIQGKTLPAELNLEDLNGVSFSKGCYVGQELTSRMHHRTQPKKRLFVVDLEAKTPIAPQSVVLNGTQEAGWLLTNDGKTGLALLRTRGLTPTTELAGDGFKLTALRKPDWAKFDWPPAASIN